MRLDTITAVASIDTNLPGGKNFKPIDNDAEVSDSEMLPSPDKQSSSQNINNCTSVKEKEHEGDRATAVSSASEPQQSDDSEMTPHQKEHEEDKDATASTASTLQQSDDHEMTSDQQPQRLKEKPETLTSSDEDRKMWFLLLLLLLVTVVTAFSFVYFLRPGLMVQVFLGLWRLRCGMQVKFIGDENYVFCYGERGQKSKERSSILLIHGFTSSKDQWNSAFKNLPKEYHLISMDMPGHGSTTTPPDSQDLSMDFGLDMIKRFAELVELTDRPFHIVGASLGGCLAGMFAAHFPHLVERVTMICPAMQCPEDSAFTQQVQRALDMGREEIELEHCSLLPQTPRELELMLDSCVYAKMNMNQQVLKGFLDLRCPRNPYFLKVFRALATEENMTMLEKNCHRITVPSQLIWGDHDQIIHPSGAELLKKNLPDCRDVTILERCGHSVDLDRPFASCSAMARFRGDTLRKQKSE
ncbi:hypothetical protein ACOMHN_041313 [Nucella lapillus]